MTLYAYNAAVAAPGTPVRHPNNRTDSQRIAELDADRRLARRENQQIASAMQQNLRDNGLIPALPQVNLMDDPEFAAEGGGAARPT